MGLGFVGSELADEEDFLDFFDVLRGVDGVDGVVAEDEDDDVFGGVRRLEFGERNE